MKEFHSGDMAQDHPLGMEGPFGRSGGPGGIDNQGRIVGPGPHRGKGSGTFFQGFPEIDHPVRGFSPGDDEGLQLRQPVLYFQDFGEIAFVGDHRPGAAVAQTVFQGLRAEEGEKGDGDAPDLINGQMGQGRLRTLRQQDPHPVSPLQAAGLQGVGQAVGQPSEIPEGIFLHPALIVFVDQGQAVALIGPLVAAVHPDIVESGDFPEKRVVDFLVGFTFFKHGKLYIIFT